MDALSQVLKAVRLEGALFYNGEYSAPWSFRAPHSSALAGCLTPAGRHVITYHLLTEGRAWVRLEGGPEVALSSGEIVIFPHGDAHVMGNGAGVEPVDHGRELARIVAQGLKVSRSGGGGEITRFVCGYMACDPHMSKVVLSGLPSVVRVPIRNDSAGAWLESSIRFSVAEAGESRAGCEAVLAKLSETLFVETLRRYVSGLPPGATGWLAGAQDAGVGKALAMLHRRPWRPWTLADLAQEAGVSRSVLAERFQRYLRETPMAYLTRLRLQLASERLTTTNRSVAEIAADVGYQSEAAFNRAFKREFGVPPARFRTQAKAATG
jgi:AraC-like DNA-binding protein